MRKDHERYSLRDIWKADIETQEAWTGAIEGTIQGLTGIGRPLAQVMEDALGIKGLIWWIEGLGQLAYTFANFMNPWAAAQHAAAATAFFYAATQANKVKSTGGAGRGGAPARQNLQRRRQTLEEAPDMSLRSPSGLTFVNLIDMRGAVGVDGRRVGNQIIDAINRGAPLRDGRMISGTVIGGGRWRW
jgi:hypothetical protein